MKFYTEIETTGQSTEFYDKFTIRYVKLLIKFTNQLKPILLESFPILVKSYTKISGL